MRRLILGLCLCLSTAPLRAEETQRPGFLDLLSFDTIATFMFNSMIQSARAFADIRYDQFSFDSRTLRMTLTNLDISPMIHRGLTCRVTARRAILHGAAFDRPDTGRFRATLDGVTVSQGCLPLDAQPAMAILQKPTIEIPHTGIDLSLHIPSGGAQVRVSATLADLTTAELFLDADYISYRMDYLTEEPQVAVDLTQASLTLTDRGAVALARKFVPAQKSSPDAVDAMVRALLTDAFSETPTPGLESSALPVPSGPSQVQQAFIDDAAQAARKLAEGSTQVVFNTGPHVPPLHLGAEALVSPGALFDRLDPSVSNTALALQQAFSADDLKAAQKGRAGPEQALQLGRAFATGVGAPLNRAQALALLEPLAADTPEAAYLSARILDGSDPARAYELALSAAQANWPDALALIDRLEGKLDYDTLMAAQDRLATSSAPDAADGALGMAALASAYASGIDEPRSYAQAYYWATMAAATGSVSAALQRDDLNEFFRLRGDAEAWRGATDDIEARVLKDWIKQDLMGTSR